MSTAQDTIPETDPTPDPEPSTDPTPDEGTPESKPEEVKGSGRFAVYDNLLLRFTGGVHDSKKAANEAKPKGARGRYETREV